MKRPRPLLFRTGLAFAAACVLFAPAHASAQTGARRATRPDDIYSKQAVRAVMRKVFDWWWCDALFMAPPVLARLYAVSGDREYLDFLDRMWWDTTDFLFDSTEGLYYRDKSYIGKPNANGRKVFWSRGNGWVMGGTVRVLQYLPKNHPARARYVQLLKTMAASVARVQGEDGLWRPSLLDPTEAPVPETSGTGFFCYALAWGVNNGVLERKTYLPVIRKAWRGLVSHVREDGKLGRVQQIGAAPAKVAAEDNQEYGSGAFLLAGSEMLKLR